MPSHASLARLALVALALGAWAWSAPAAAQTCVACGQCSGASITCSDGSSVFVNATCTPGGQIMTISAQGRSMTCNCCDSACDSEPNVIATLGLCGTAPLGGTSGSGSASKAPAGPGATTLQGPQMGQPFFSFMPLMDNEQLRADAAARWSAARTYSNAGGRASTRSGQRAGARDLWHHGRHRTPGCFSISTTAKLAYFSSLATTEQPADQSFWPPLAPGGTPIDASNAQPITGVGAFVGPKDIPPNPNPQVVNNPNECNKNWYFSRKTKECYFTQAMCDADSLHGPCSIPNPTDPALRDAVHNEHVQSWNNCHNNTWYNECTRACYPGQSSCEAQIPVQSGCTCMGPMP